MAQKKRSRSRVAKAKDEPVSEQWRKALEKVQGEPKAYAMQEKFAEGEVIDHPTFGKGVILELVDHNKIKTLFENSIKTLIHSQT